MSLSGHSKFKTAFSFFLLVLFVAGFLLAASVFMLRQEKEHLEEKNSNPEVSILRTADNSVETLALEEVVVGVLAGEMPADFELEALKAQAVAARTYILKRLPEPYGSGLAVHTGNAYICDNFAHCQAYVDDKQRQENWGDKFTEKEAKIREAVTATAGLVITYGGEVISPTFCSTCGGKTEAAADYWQSEVPALQAVSCYWDTEAPKYLSKVYYTKAEMASKLGITQAELPNLKIVKTSETGRVMQVVCGEKQWKGSAVRTALNLNSTDFQWMADKNGYLITVKGYGHGVGLCQHGANGMAKAGADYSKIIHHYYTDVEISKISDLQ
ncbi:MAG: stage II sporulation protein D [Bacillota bacterium]